MRRIVLDTNVLVSALLSVNGNEALVLRLAFSGAFEIGVSVAILNEYREVLQRPRFNISRSKLADLFSQLETQARLVHPLQTVGVSPDETDNRFLECAEALDAEFLITGTSGTFLKPGRERRS